MWTNSILAQIRRLSQNKFQFWALLMNIHRLFFTAIVDFGTDLLKYDNWMLWISLKHDIFILIWSIFQSITRCVVVDVVCLLFSHWRHTHTHTYSSIHIHNQNSNKIKYESLPSLFDKSGKQREISRESDDKQRQQTNKHWHGWITRSSYGERGKAVWYHWIIEIWIESSNRNGMILYNIWCTPPSQINNIFVRSIALEIDFGGWFFVVCLGMRCSSNIFGPDWQNCLYSIFAIQLQSNANYLNKSKLIGAFADWHFAWIYNQIFRFLMCHSDIPMIWWSNVATIPVP